MAILSNEMLAQANPFTPERKGLPAMRSCQLVVTAARGHIVRKRWLFASSAIDVCLSDNESRRVALLGAPLRARLARIAVRVADPSNPGSSH